MSKLESQSESNRKAEAAEPLQPRIPHPPSPCGLFGKFPRELLDSIYQSVFTAGETALTRTSKAMHVHTKEALSRYGVYSLRIEFARLRHYFQYQMYYGGDYYLDDAQTYHLSHPTPGTFLAHVRSVNVRVILERPSPDRSLRYPCIPSGMLDKILRDVIGSMTQHTHCRISLQLRRYRKVQPEWFACLKQLRRFQSVEVELCHAPWETWGQYSSQFREMFPREYRENAGVAVEAVGSYLKPKKAGMSGPSVRVVQRNLFVMK